MITVLAYPGMADGDIIDEIEALTSDPAQAFQVLSVAKNQAEDTAPGRSSSGRRQPLAVTGANYDEAVRIVGYIY